MAICSKCGRDTRRYQSIPGVGDFCSGTCAPGLPKRMKLSTFPFTTTNLRTGEATTVNSLAHLRKIEAEDGVQSVAYNQNEKNWDPPQYDPAKQQAQVLADLRRQRRA